MESQPSTFQLSDIYYALFRHKWKVILCSVLGFIGAAAVYQLMPPPYLSEAKLYIRYVITEGKALTPGNNDSMTKSPDQRGETIMSSEVQILSSLDLAQDVAKSVGPAKILAKLGGGSEGVIAASYIQRNLIVDVPRYSSVITIVFAHPDPEVAQLVLKELVDRYLKKHVEIHRSMGMVGDFLTQETDQLRTRLAQTEEELRKAMSKAGILSLEDFKKSSNEQTLRLRQQIFDLQAELAERTTVFTELTKGSVQPSTAKAATDFTPAPANASQIEAYRLLATRLNSLKEKELVTLSQFTAESGPVRTLRGQIADLEAQRAKMEQETPSLASVPAALPVSGSRGGEDFNPAMEAAKIEAMQVKLKALNSQLESLRNDSAKVEALETSILELRRRKDLEENNYRYYAASLEQSRITEALSSGQVSNISQIETPTPAARDSKKTTKTMMSLAFGGVALGLLWALAIEFYFDHSVRRPGEVERVLRFPLFLSVPKLSKKEVARQIKAAEASQLQLMNASSQKSEEAKPGGNQTALVESNAKSTSSAYLAVLNPYHETLRDRLISFFDSLNLQHKPKLVAVTGVGKGTGVTTTAAGLARSFSETGEGNVLLVDMTQEQGSAQQFRKGKAVGIEDMLDTRHSAQVDEHLYVVTENSSSDRLAKNMPQRFNQMIPKLKASDFDYIIFDMPAVNQISLTPRLANFMDMVLLVVESEKTNRDVAQHAADLLAKSKAPVGVVLNKTETYIPTKLNPNQDFFLGS
jgi:uncharacterized protein involved in exopolysaccharide biosynthesis/Mrp family chromosome partitioning ATPase